MAKRYYTLDPHKYNYDEIFGDEAREAESDALLQSLSDPHIVKYRTKTIKSGNVLEVEVYPIWETHTSTSRARKTKESREAQKRLNYKNAVKTVVRLINANFTDADFWATFTYSEKRLPKTYADAQKEMQKFIRRLKHYAERHNFPPLKYVYWTEFENDEKKGKHRMHHHLVTNFADRDKMEDLWGNGGRNNVRRLVADDSGYEGMARYCMKDPKGLKRYVASKNLKKPQITVSDTKFTRRKVNRIMYDKVNPYSVFEGLYKGYQMTDITKKTSEYTTGAYVYVKMKRKE